MNLRKLKTARSAVLVLGGLGCIVAGIWLIMAILFGAAIGTGAGLLATGLALLLIEWGAE
jgi:hypothetical protein